MNGIVKEYDKYRIFDFKLVCNKEPSNDSWLYVLDFLEKRDKKTY